MRKLDSKGDKIYYRDEFVLQSKTFKDYISTFVDFPFSYRTSNDFGDAIVLSGYVLNNMAYDWSMSYNAVKID